MVVLEFFTFLSDNSYFYSKNEHRPSWPAEWEASTTSTYWVGGYNVLHHQQLQEQLQP